MDIELTPIEVRVLGCLIEKEIATPDHYPLTLNALVNACNQKSNRLPVMALDENTVMRTLDELRMTYQLAIEVTSSSSRVPKYKHNFRAKWNFSPAKTAILCELFLRGAQTSGDLRAHASRLHPLADWHEVEEILQGLEMREDNPFVVHLPREPGRRERRWAHLLSGEPETPSEPELLPEVATGGNDQILALEGEVAALRQELDELKASFAEFKTAFE
ncbi:MAG: YceH family protein [Verrucomicrobia bacterium]|nr:YceH family protein [Verrucomicrobiota bacterium]